MSDAVSDMSPENILKTGLALSVGVVVVTLGINAAPYAVKGAAGMVKHGTSLFLETLRLPFRFAGFLKDVKEDVA